MKLDFHIHTNASVDSSIKPEELILKSKELGIIPAITDHNSIASHKKFREARAPFIPGEEVHTDIGDLIGLYLNEAIEKKTPFLETLDKIKEQGGISYLPHGFDKLRFNIGARFPEYAKKVQIIEIFNAGCITNEPNKKAEEFARKNKKLTAGGSDAHLLMEFGKTYTKIPDCDLENPKALLNALKKSEIHGTLTPKYMKGVKVVLSRINKIRRMIFQKK